MREVELRGRTWTVSCPHTIANIKKQFAVSFSSRCTSVTHHLRLFVATPLNGQSVNPLHRRFSSLNVRRQSFLTADFARACRSIPVPAALAGWL